MRAVWRGVAWRGVVWCGVVWCMGKMYLFLAIMLAVFAICAMVLSPLCVPCVPTAPGWRAAEEAPGVGAAEGSFLSGPPAAGSAATASDMYFSCASALRVGIPPLLCGCGTGNRDGGANRSGVSVGIFCFQGRQWMEGRRE